MDHSTQTGSTESVLPLSRTQAPLGMPGLSFDVPNDDAMCYSYLQPQPTFFLLYYCSFSLLIPFVSPLLYTYVYVCILYFAKLFFQQITTYIYRQVRTKVVYIHPILSVNNLRYLYFFFPSNNYFFSLSLFVFFFFYI